MGRRLRKAANKLKVTDGRLVLPELTEIKDGLVPTGGQFKYQGRTDVQVQIDSNAAQIAAVHGHTEASVCYVDSKRTDSYVEDGTESKPYKTLSAAVTAKLADGETDFVSFRLSSGNYDGVISRDKSAQEQSFEIVGQGSHNTFIRGAASFASTTGSVLYFRDFWDITLKGVSVQNGAYGFYPRKCRNVKVIDCEFKYLGSDGTESLHDMSSTQAQQAAHWAGTGTSDGGTMRVRDCDDLVLKNCSTSYCLRGYRIQDVKRGTITGCRAYKLLESAYYLASGSYDGANGCKNFYISGCVADTILHSGFLVIGGQNNTIQACTAINCTASPFNGFHTQDMRVCNCIADNCNTKDFIGIGILGDAFGQVYMAGGTNLTDTGGHMLTCTGCNFLRCGQGRHTTPTAFYVLDDPGLVSSRLVLDNNNFDAVASIYNPESVPLRLTQYPAQPSYAASRALVSNAAGVAEASSVTATQLGYLDATSSIQTQLDSKGTTFSGTADRVIQTDGSGALEASSVTATQLGYLDATSSIQTQLDSKGATFAGTASRVIQTDANGALSASSVTATQLSYLDATSSIQTQLDNAGFSGTADRVMITDGSGDASASSVTATQLSYLDATSSIQTQLDNAGGGGVSSTNAVFDGNSFGIHFAGEGVFNYKNASSLYQVTHKGSYLKCKWSGGAYLANLNNNGRIDIKDEAYLRMNPRSEPSGAQDGSFYYDSTANAFKFKQNGSWVTLS